MLTNYKPGSLTRRGNPLPCGEIFLGAQQECVLGKGTKMKNSNDAYRFVSKAEEVDYLRILREAPQGTLFILVEVKTRQNKPKSWTLFVHKKILNNPDLKDKKLGFLTIKHGDHFHTVPAKISSGWGDEVKVGPSVDPNFRYLSGTGKVSGLIKHHVDSVRYHKKRKADRAERDTLTEVQYL